MTGSAIEVPYQQARQAFVATAKELGCPDVEAVVIGQTAWHLTNRGLGGIAYTLRYLALLARDESLPRLAISLMAIDVSDHLNGNERRSQSFVGLPAPLMVLPAASFRLNEIAENDGVLFTYEDVTLVYSKTHGTRLIDGSAESLNRIDPLSAPSCTASRIDYAEAEGLGVDLGFVKNETLVLPAALYNGPDQAFDLDLLRQI